MMLRTLRRRMPLAIALLLAGGATLHAQATSLAPSPTTSSTRMPAHATGPFDVKVTPRAPDASSTPGPVGIMSLDKQFHGDLEAASVGEMLAWRGENGAAAYVALERVTGTLGGRTGSFVLHHTGTMTKDGQHLVVTVAPSSGTGELAGISGTMTIRIEGKAHFYDFDYTLPPGARD